MPDPGLLLLHHKLSAEVLLYFFLWDAGPEQPVCLGTASWAVMNTGQFCGKEPTNYGEKSLGKYYSKLFSFLQAAGNCVCNLSLLTG